jgi:hypothetical protein
MAFILIPRKYSCGNFYLLLPEAIKFSCDVLFEPCDHASVKTLLRRRLQVVDQLQQVTTSTPMVMPFSASSFVDMLPSAEMEESWDGGVALRSQCPRPLPSRRHLPLHRKEVTKSPVKLVCSGGPVIERVP